MTAPGLGKAAEVTAGCTLFVEHAAGDAVSAQGEALSAEGLVASTAGEAASAAEPGVI